MSYLREQSESQDVSREKMCLLDLRVPIQRENPSAETEGKRQRAVVNSNPRPDVDLCDRAEEFGSSMFLMSDHC